MRKVLNGGSVRRQDGEDKAVAVVSIAFSGPSSPGCDGVLNVKVAPQDEYELGDALLYQDGDGQNPIKLEVLSAVGPVTYNVQVV